MVKLGPALTVGRPLPVAVTEAAAAAGAGGGVAEDLFEAGRMEVGAAVGLQVVGAADSGVRHDRRAAAGFVGGGGAAIAVAAGIGAAVERVRRAELMAELVGDVVNVERIAHRRVGAGLALGLEAGHAGDADARQAAARSAEHVADVVIGAADDRVEVGLVLRQQGRGVAVAVRFGGGIGIDDQVVVGDQHQPNAQLRTHRLPSPG